MTTAEPPSNYPFFFFCISEQNWGFSLMQENLQCVPKDPLGWLLLSALSRLNIKMEIPPLA